MNLFSDSEREQIEAIAAKSCVVQDIPKKSNKSINSITAELNKISDEVKTYFKDSKAVLVNTKDALVSYIDKLIESGIAGIDTETTGLDRQKDYVVGMSLYTYDLEECYIPFKHRVPIFDTFYANQLTYEDVQEQLQRLVDAKVKLVFANADFDLAMIYKDIKIDLCPIFYYDVILAWRCIQENEKDNSLKGLYAKYVADSSVDAKSFADFFSVEMFPYCHPDVAKLYAANDAKITLLLYDFQQKFVGEGYKDTDTYMKSIARLVWDVEFPLVKICQQLHRTGIYFDKTVSHVIEKRYNDKLTFEENKLCDLIDSLLLDSNEFASCKNPPFRHGRDFNPKSVIHMRFLVYDILKVPVGREGKSTDKSILTEMNLSVTNQILVVRSLQTLISSFTSKLPKVVAQDGRIHAQFKQIGASTGRFSSAEPNMQNIPSHADDIRHIFRATPGYVMLSSDYSAQEPRITAFVSKDPKMIKSFKDGRDIYASIASISFGVPYEKCLEFHPETGEYQPDGKKRRTEAKSVVLGRIFSDLAVKYICPDSRNPIY